MPKIGIIAEFNPFHQGHMYLMDYARNTLGASSIIIALGHEFTQRGDVALLDRYTRARSARSCGADLVLGMPVAASCGSAEVFARCGASLLSTAGCDTILCGWEGSDAMVPSIEKALLFEIAGLLSEEPKDYKKVLSEQLKTGKSYPAARTNAVLSCISSDSKKAIARDLLSSPNNILALEYARAIHDLSLPLELVLLARKGSDYHSTRITKDFYASATSIRQKLASMEVLYQKGSLKPDQFRQSLSPHMPKESYQLLEQAFIKKLLLFPSDVDILLHTKLFEKEELTAFADCTDDLQNRILKNRDQYIGYEAFADLLKNKSLTRSRITRVLTHILLGITDEDLTLLKRRDYAPYFWILAASAKGKGSMGVLKQKDLPLFCSINEISSSLSMEKSDTQRLLALDLKASEVVRILRIHKCRRPLPTEYTRKVVL